MLHKASVDLTLGIGLIKVNLSFEIVTILRKRKTQMSWKLIRFN